jgi:excinuclease ABC subunit B
MTSPTTLEFSIQSDYAPDGDQPQAIEGICAAFKQNSKHHVLLGVTGSGKTFTMAHTIARLGAPALIMAPNKTLAAQLFQEFKELFPNNAVEFFISYYDYYQPEAYLPNSDTYIAKDAMINDDIDKMRHSATRSLFERKDVIIISSVSCIYGLGSPQSYAALVVNIEQGQKISRDDFLRKLVDIHYTRNDARLSRGSFRVRGDVVDVLPSHQKNEAIRFEFFGDEVELIQMIDALSGQPLKELKNLSLYPNSHYVAERKDIQTIIKEILTDLGIRLRELKAAGKWLEFQRLEKRVMQDVEMFEQLGWCSGVENYSRYLTGGVPGEPPPTLLDYFPENFITILDESHITAPQIRGMFRGDRARKEVLVNYGFRLPSALDNRPLNFEEFLNRTNKILHVSATPGPYELGASDGQFSEQIIRPTGLLDPEIEVRSAQDQIDNLYGEILKVIANNGRILVTTLTKKMSEKISEYFSEMQLKASYLHSDVDSLQRAEILKDLRSGVIDVLIGINLLREGLDLPEVKLVAILDADKEGFLRSKSALIQTVGRAARNAEGRVIFYANRITDSMRHCIDETNRRRRLQKEYNTEHNITPQSIIKKMPRSLRELYGIKDPDEPDAEDSPLSAIDIFSKYMIKSMQGAEKLLRKMDKQMEKKAAAMEFERAAELRDQIDEIRRALLELQTNDIKSHEASE